MRRLTVLQLLPALHSGGVERSTIEIADALVRAGHRAVVVSAGGRLLPALLATGAEHISVDIGRKSLATLRHIGTLRQILLREKPDIVHARSRLPAWLGWRALRGLPAPLRARFVTTVHGLNSPGIYSQVMTFGERVICVSDSVRGYVLKHYPRTAVDKLRVIPRGIDPLQFPPRPRPDPAARARFAAADPRLGGDGPLLLMPGRGTRLKGHADALQLLAGLRATGVDARLWLLGTDEPGRQAYVAELTSLAEQAGVEAALIIAPPTAAIADAYAAADLVLQLSRKPEAFGRTVIEALAVGRPVVGWDHGGVGELLAQLQPAGAVTPFEQAALLQAAGDMLASPGPALASIAPYTLASMQQATLNLYQELADDPRHAAAS
ncbi:glycosyltransferase [Pseudoxanthomonas dokdonensis]|uniref:Glycosyl transferase n=1 Tax=Pseudoxanthomonas dokdonensis TaxID=344882 RepID=A0A0R0CTM9_9GAMM|nr:glycosyltransferase [Pseudoxanthomonas dokdonensis]KRG68611.1 glycosyl transferase [Pseudoxanthomonas dokdonensis]